MQHIRARLAQSWERGRLRLSAAEALPLLAGLGLLVGLLSGLAILAFRALVEYSQRLFLPAQDHFETLAPHWRLLLPLGGGLLIGVYLHLLKPRQREFGVAHVMGRVAFHQGYMPWRNAVHQFVLGAGAIISGQSVGREGPGVHLGAASGSQLGQALGLPNNSLRVLVGCGTAAAIGASFNTPLAGVAFAMEVVMLEYTIAGFLPIMLAAVAATALSQVFYGDTLAFAVPPLQLSGLAEIPHVVLTGCLIGVLAAGFIHAMQHFSALGRGRPVILRGLAAGLGVGLCALFVPQIMGIGYDTVADALTGELGWGLLIAIAAFKLLASSWGIALGLPGGLIGPTLVIGATAGGALGNLGAWINPESIAAPAFYALLGMGAMMGATLRAPLAALTAMLELTGNPGVIMPGLLAIVAATLTCTEGFGKDSVFAQLLRDGGDDLRPNPLLSGLSRLGVARVMDRRLAVLPRIIERAALNQALAEDPRWLLLREEEQEQAVSVMPATDVLRYLEEHEDEQELDLLAIPAQRLQPAPIEIRATLREAFVQLRRRDAEALYVVQTTAPGITRYFGLVTKRELENQFF
ncbi:chloride channel protein [Alkalilimnicola sp. S0819]|uniref:chloride channel protein n=1 Tax=Alkalilimnicola sp. S0819 TaxID=2613922 RepID=UPI0012618E30|nr:chloride channel protein [Alkalilimnicola sp. S0819]KAB7623040.1 chloride channel protein [Alkalilimnicola sp. S0819]MPQ17153.1 chloride channel protein [Alkalilimnicola sp. S0819]